MKAPAITVLMTVFNAGRFLDASIRSIVNQTFSDWEFLIVDDASTDGSAARAAGWAQVDPRIRLISNAANQGQTPCLNQGLREARGAWIARQDADDLSKPDRFARQVAASGELALLGTNGWMIDGNDRVVGLVDVPLGQESIVRTSPILNPFLHTSVLARTAVIRDELGGYDESFRIAQDYELWTRVLARHPAANLAERLVCYRHLPTSLSKSGRSAAFEEARRVSEREARRVFPRALSAGEHALLAAFREGLDERNRKAFWHLYAGLCGTPKHRKDAARTAALHHLKAAGAMQRRGAALAEVGAALWGAPGVTLGWLAQRFSAR